MRIIRLAAMLALSASAVAAQDQRPLEAALRRGATEPVFYLDQPAYVAVFEVVPGVGVQQLYPRSSQQSRMLTEPGEYLLSRPFRSGFGYSAASYGMPYPRPMYVVDASGRVISYYYSTAYGPGDRTFGYSGRTRTLLLVASRQPLRRVSSPDAAASWLQQVVGFRSVSSTLYAPDAMLRDVADAVLPLGVNVDDVVVDVLDYDESDYGYRWASQNIVFYCPSVNNAGVPNGGGYVTMPADYFFGTGIYYCPPINRTTTVTSTPAAPQPPDSSGAPEEGFKKPRRAPGPDYSREEGFAQVRRVGSTPNAPLQEEGFASYRRGVTPQPNAATPTGAYVPGAPGMPREEGFRSGRVVPSVPQTGGSATFAAGVPMSTEGFTSRTVGHTSAWTPPVPGSPTYSGSGAGFRTSSGYESASRYDGVRSTTNYNSGQGSYSNTNNSGTYTTGTVVSTPAPAAAAPATEGVRATGGVTSKKDP